MGSCLSKLGNKSNTVKCSNPDYADIKKCNEPDKSSQISVSLSPTQETTNVCQEMGILPILENRSISPTKLCAIKKEQALSFEEFRKPTYIRDHTECKETFKAIGGERN